MPLNIAQPRKYGYVSLTPDASFRKWITEACKKLDIENIIKSRDIHCTLIYDDTNPIDVETMLKNRDFNKVYEAKINSIKPLGSGKWAAVVFGLESKDLQDRHKELLKLGFNHSYSGFIPHISIKYQPLDSDLEKLQSDRFISALRAYGKDITLSMEQWEVAKA